MSRSPIFNNFFETINGASTIRAFDQQQRLIRDNYYRVDENNVAFYPGTSANRCVVNTILFIPEAYLVHSDRNVCQMWLYYCLLLWILGKCSCCWISTWSLKVLVKGENAKRSQKLKHTLRHSGKSLRQVVSGPGLTTRKEFENVVLASQTHQMFSVHTTTEKFENGIVTLKTHHMYSVHITTEKFWNCVWKNSVREITWLSWRHRFRKTPFWKCFSSSGLKSVLEFKLRFRDGLPYLYHGWGLKAPFLRLKKMPIRK